VDDPVSKFDPLGLFDMSGFTGQKGLQGVATQGMKDMTPVAKAPKPKLESFQLMERPLDGVPEILSKKIPALHHRQFVGNDGSNFGRFSDGIRADDEANMSKYKPHGDGKKFDPQIINDARNRYDAKKADTDERLAQLPDEDRWVDSSNLYYLGPQDCQRYTDDIVDTAGELAKKQKKELIIKRKNNK